MDPIIFQEDVTALISHNLYAQFCSHKNGNYKASQSFIISALTVKH